MLQMLVDTSIIISCGENRLSRHLVHVFKTRPIGSKLRPKIGGVDKEELAAAWEEQEPLKTSLEVPLQQVPSDAVPFANVCVHNMKLNR